jgi:hypothetical protein
MKVSTAFFDRIMEGRCIYCGGILFHCREGARIRLLDILIQGVDKRTGAEEVKSDTVQTIPV